MTDDFDFEYDEIPADERARAASHASRRPPAAGPSGLGGNPAAGGGETEHLTPADWAREERAAREADAARRADVARSLIARSERSPRR